ncbi:MAG: hypothetical protein Q4E17_02315 [Synergistes sp.]|nr:hypothetical protein [Synergistes sp.]
MANIRHLSTSLRLALTVGANETKSVSVSKISEAITAAKVESFVEQAGNLLEYPIATAKKYDTGILESE